MSEFEIFEAAKKLTDPVARAAFVDLACAGNAELRAGVLQALKTSEQPCEFLDVPTASVSPEPVDPERASTFVPSASSPPASGSRVIAGKYKLVQEIGEGGMGTVYMAEQLTPRRKVALKLIKKGRDSKAILARFAIEQQAIALMNHPNVAKFFEAGETEDHEPFFVMELINGKPIVAYCDENRLTLDERIALFIPVCHAIQHAHHKGIIHRDITARNILVADHDGVPVAYVIDFGLAKAVGQPLTDHTSPTLFGTVAGTPGYMSPEQATFNQLDIDARSDIYSLAAVLYELLTGSTPHAKADLEKKAVLEVMRIIREDEPAWASHRLSSSNTLPSLAASRRIDPRRLVGLLKGELDLVVMKALERERNRRYQHPSDLADDLQRFLDHEPVRAAPPSITYRVRKYLSKRWKVALVAVSLLCTASVGVIGVVWQEIQKQETSRLAELRTTVAEGGRKTADAQKVAALARADATARNAELIRERAESRVREAASSEYVGIMGNLSHEENQRSLGWAERSWELLQRVTKLQSPLRNDPDIRTAAATVLIADEYRAKPDWTFNGSKADGVNDGKVTCAAYSPSGGVLAVTPYSDYLHPQPRLLLLDATTGKVKLVLSGADNWPSQEAIPKSTINALRSRFDQCIFLDTDHVLLAGTRLGRLYRWDVSKSPPVVKFVNVGNSSVHLFVTPNSRWCVTRCWGSKQLQCWNTETLEPAGIPVEFEMPTEGVTSVDNESILVHTQSGTHLLSLPDLKVKQEVVRSAWGVFHPSGQFYATHNGQTLYAASWPDSVPLQVYENYVKEGPIRLELTASSELRTRSGYSQTGQIFATTFANERGSEFRMWDAWGGKPRWRLLVPDGTVLRWGGQAISGDADHAVIIAKEDVTQFSRLRPTLAFCRAPGHPNGVRYVRTAPDGTAIAVLGERRKDGNDSFVVSKTGDAPQTLHSSVAERIGSIPSEAVDLLSYSPNGKWLATVGNSATGIGIIVSSTTNLRTDLSVSVLHEGRAIGRPNFDAGAVAGFGWSSRGELVAAIDMYLFAWDLQTNPPSLIGRGMPNNLLGSPRRYASMAMNGTDVGWVVTIQSELRNFRVGDGRIEIMKRVAVPGEGNSRICRIDPSNKRLAIGKADGSVVLFDTKSEVFGKLMAEGHADSVQAMVWLSDRRLVTGSRDGWFAIWNVSDDGKASLWYRLQLKAPVSDIAPTANKQAVYVACSDETSLRVLNLDVIDIELEELFSKSTPTVPFDSGAARPDIDVATRDQDIIGRVALGAARNKATEPVINYAAESEAAKWVVSIGGTVTIVDRNGREIPYEAEQLPQQKYLVRDVRIDGATGLTKAGLAKLRGCQALTTLELVNLPEMTDEVFASLEGSGIRSLSIELCPALTDKVTSSLAKLSRLESLTLHAGSLTDGCLSLLGPLKKLSKVTIAEPGITNAGLAKLAEACPRISFLDISSAPHPNLTASSLASFDELSEVRLSGPQLTDEAIRSINSLPDLTTLHLIHSVNDDIVRRLGRLTGVTKLFIQSNSVEDRTVLSPSIYAKVTWPPSLMSLYFVGSKVAPRDEDLMQLSELKQLRVLGLNCRQPPAQSPRYNLSGLARFRRLRPNVLLTDEGGPRVDAAINYAEEREAAEWVLSIGGNVSLKDTGGKPLPLREGKLPDASFLLDAVFLVDSARFTNEGLSNLFTCQQITDVTFSTVSKLTDEGISNLRAARIRNLTIHLCPLITDKALASIATFEGLESLNLNQLGITDAGVAALAPLVSLRTFNASTTLITDAGLIQLAQVCPRITHLSIERSREGQQTVRGVAKFQKLNQLVINGNQFTDDAVNVVNAIPTLGFLQICSPMNDAIIARLPRLKAVNTIGLGSNGNESSARLPATFLSDIAWPAGLQNLYLSGGAVSPRDEDLLFLAKLPNFKGIGVGGAKEASHPQRWTYAGFLKLRELRPDIQIGMDHLFYGAGKPLPPTPPQDQTTRPK